MRLQKSQEIHTQLYFNPHTSHEVRHLAENRYYIEIGISIHTPLTRCDLYQNIASIITVLFQSTHLSRGATKYGICSMSSCISFQSTHLSRGATQVWYMFNVFMHFISIHTPLTRCDGRNKTYMTTDLDFNPHTSHEVRRKNINTWTIIQLFQSTHLSRGATGTLGVGIVALRFQSTHLSRGATVLRSVVLLSSWKFQSTHLSRGATILNRCVNTTNKYFNPHTSHEVRPISLIGQQQSDIISIHTPLTRCDG